MKRIFLFVATNFAIMIVLGIVLSILMPMLGLDQSSYSGLLFMCAIFGMGGSFISLLMSKWIAKRSVGAHVIESPNSAEQRWLLETVRRQAQQASPRQGMERCGESPASPAPTPRAARTSRFSTPSRRCRAQPAATRRRSWARSASGSASASSTGGGASS